MYEIEFKPKVAKKGQVVASFISEFIDLGKSEICNKKEDKDEAIWQMEVDGACNKFGA